MKFFWHPKTRSARVGWMLEEVGCEYEKVLIDIRDEDARGNADFRAASPLGKVPALADGENRLADSAAICLYLADRYSQGTLAPAIDADTRGTFLFWMFFAPGVIEPCMAERFGTSQANRVSHGWGDFATMIECLETALDKDHWLVANTFSAADVMVGGSCHFMQQFGILPESRPIASYIERCTQRPAFQRGFV